MWELMKIAHLEVLYSSEESVSEENESRKGVEAMLEKGKGID